MSVRLGRFVECCGMLPITQFTYRKGMGTCDAPFVRDPYTAECIGECGGVLDRAD